MFWDFPCAKHVFGLSLYTGLTGYSFTHVRMSRVQTWVVLLHCQTNVLPPPPPTSPSTKTLAAYTVSASSLTMEVDAVSHTCSPQDCFKMWLSAHACRHPHRINERATNSEKGDWKPRLACANNVRHSPSETPVDILSWTCRSQGR